MTTQELKDIFGKRAIQKICREKIKECEDQIKEIKNRQYSLLPCLADCTGRLEVVCQAMMDTLDIYIHDQQKEIKKWSFKYQQYSDTPPQNLPQGYDLDAIKRIPCESLLPPAVHKNHATSHYKAPWRNEKSPSLVVYHKDNRWWDFGENCGGTVIDLVMKLEDCDFKQAIKYLIKS
ncbi:MAG: hypothetical protein H6743_03910 [Rickettsiaceae bacterium]|nr:hypothetical protein [Rickettsiaceae bacterium]